MGMAGAATEEGGTIITTTGGMEVPATFCFYAHAMLTPHTLHADNARLFRRK